MGFTKAYILVYTTRNMPVTRSASKKLRVDERRTVVNLRRKRTLKSILKQARASKTAEAIRLAIQQIDKAVKHNLMHKNKGARLKSQLTKGSKAIAAKTTTKKTQTKSTSKAKAKKSATKKTPPKSRKTK